MKPCFGFVDNETDVNRLYEKIQKLAVFSADLHTHTCAPRKTKPYNPLLLHIRNEKEKKNSHTHFATPRTRKRNQITQSPNQPNIVFFFVSDCQSVGWK